MQRPLLSKARTTEHWPPLRRLERNCSVLTALTTCRPGLSASLLSFAGTLRFALFAPFGVVLEIFLVKEQLFACRKHELGGAIDARQYSIGELHGWILQELYNMPNSGAAAAGCRQMEVCGRANGVHCLNNECHTLYSVFFAQQCDDRHAWLSPGPSRYAMIPVPIELCSFNGCSRFAGLLPEQG